MISVHVPRGLFQGTNFMTPNVIGYFKLRKGLGYAELSHGTGINNQPIYGVTIRPRAANGSEDLSTLCQSRAEAERYIEGLS